MKEIVISLLIASLCVLFSTAAQSQDNVFLDRDYWKGQPTLDDVKSKIKAGNSSTAMTSANFDATSYAILEKLPLETIKHLLAQGNDVNKLTHDARTYLFWAAYKSNIPLMDYLIAKGAKTDLVDQHGYSVFMFAAVTAQENKEVYDYIIKQGADPMSERDRDGRNALLAYASATNTGAMLDYFVGSGLDINSVDKDGNGIFHQAARTGNQELLERLISEYKVNTSPNAKTDENAILFASRRSSRSGDETSVGFYEYLEGLGLDPTIVTKNGNTVLQNLARRSNSLELYNYCIDKGINVNQVDDKGNNALMLAASRKNQELIALLAENTSDINVQNKEGHTAFTRALKYNKLEIAQYLAERGASTDISDKKGYDLGYHLIDALRGDMDSFKQKMDYLISLGYDPLSIQGDGSTLLHAAINKKHMNLVKLVAQMDIDINAKDESGQTALHYAAMQADDIDLLKFLVAAGADKGITTEFDESAYDLAMSNEQLNADGADIDFLKVSGE